MRFPVRVEGVKLFRVHQVNWNNCVTCAGEILLKAIVLEILPKALVQHLHLEGFSQ